MVKKIILSDKYTRNSKLSGRQLVGENAFGVYKKQPIKSRIKEHKPVKNQAEFSS